MSAPPLSVCATCRHADWKRHSDGALHETNEGWCTWQYEAPRIPASMWFYVPLPRPCGGAINRYSKLFKACPTWEKKDD